VLTYDTPTTKERNNNNKKKETSSSGVSATATDTPVATTREGYNNDDDDCGDDEANKQDSPGELLPATSTFSHTSSLSDSPADDDKARNINGSGDRGKESYRWLSRD
jgi:hypothetical protein